MKKEYIYLAGGAVAALVGNKFLSAKKDISNTEAKDFVNKWIKTVGENNLIGYGDAPLTQEQINKASGTVAELYCVNATLVSTVGDVIYYGRAEIQGYFRNFLANEPQGTLNCNGIIDPDEEEAPPCPEDVNLDGAISVADVLAVLSEFGCEGTACQYDIDGDEAVTVTDVLVLLSAFGTDCS